MLPTLPMLPMPMMSMMPTLSLLKQPGNITDGALMAKPATQETLECVVVTQRGKIIEENEK